MTGGATGRGGHRCVQSANVHGRTLADVTTAAEAMEAAPPAFLRLDLAPLLETAEERAARALAAAAEPNTATCLPPVPNPTFPSSSPTPGAHQVQAGRNCAGSSRVLRDCFSAAFDSCWGSAAPCGLL